MRHSMGHGGPVVPKRPLCGTQVAPNPIDLGTTITTSTPSINRYPYVVSWHHMGLATLWGGDTQWDTQWDMGVWWSPNVPSVALR